VMYLKVAARDSDLSKDPCIRFEVTYLKTTGDLDLKTPLESLDKTDFFTKEVDELVLQGSQDIGIHSAKDLPYPLTHDLEILAITEGVDGSDSLVFQNGSDLHSLPYQARVGVSSNRRRDVLLQLRSDLVPVSIRGNIQRRLSLLDQNEVQAVVIAEAAIIRLKLEDLPRIKLNGFTPPLQGKLAIVAKNHSPLKSVFKKLDVYADAFEEMVHRQGVS